MGICIGSYHSQIPIIILSIQVSQAQKLKELKELKKLKELKELRQQSFWRSY